MANTYTQLYIQVVICVQYRQGLIDPSWKDHLYRYMAGILKNHGHHPIMINGVADHVHIFFGLHPIQSISELMQQLKRDSSKWINEQGLTPCRFRWQPGFGAFSYQKDMVPVVTRYIERQEEHHRKKSFQEEYESLLQKFGVPYKKEYLFEPPV